MTPALRVLAAALLGALLLTWPSAVASPAVVAGPAPARADGDRAVFTGTFVRAPQLEVEGATTVRRYQVAVQLVYGDVPITTQRVTVRSRLALERCGLRSTGLGQGSAGQGQAGGAQQQGAPSEPVEPTSPTTSPDATSIDKRLRVFEATVAGGAYVVNACTDVTIADAAVLAALVGRFGDGRPPGGAVEPSPELDEVAYLCPGTQDPVDLDDPDSCSALDDGQSFDRAAAPGLALLIVGVLGLLVVRRMGRRRG